jgi:hypothetical protein
MRRYRPFLIYNPSKGWAFYPNRATSSLTYKNVGTPKGRRVFRTLIGWFHDAPTAALFERTQR